MGWNLERGLQSCKNRKFTQSLVASRLSRAFVNRLYSTIKDSSVQMENWSSRISAQGCLQNNWWKYGNKDVKSPHLTPLLNIKGTSPSTTNPLSTAARKMSSVSEIFFDLLIYSTEKVSFPFLVRTNSTIRNNRWVLWIWNGFKWFIAFSCSSSNKDLTLALLYEARDFPGE